MGSSLNSPAFSWRKQTEHAMAIRQAKAGIFETSVAIHDRTRATEKGDGISAQDHE
jgi:hypothetical protein